MKLAQLNLGQVAVSAEGVVEHQQFEYLGNQLRPMILVSVEDFQQSEEVAVVPLGALNLGLGRLQNSGGEGFLIHTEVSFRPGLV